MAFSDSRSRQRLWSEETTYWVVSTSKSCKTLKASLNLCCRKPNSNTIWYDGHLAQFSSSKKGELKAPRTAQKVFLCTVVLLELNRAGNLNMVALKDGKDWVR